MVKEQSTADDTSNVNEEERYRFIHTKRTRALIPQMKTTILGHLQRLQKLSMRIKKLLFVLSDGKIKGKEGTGLQRVMKIKL